MTKGSPAKRNGSSPATKSPKSPPAVTSAQVAGDDGPTDLTFGFGQRKPVDENEFKKFLKDIEKKRRQAGSIKNCEFNENRARRINGIFANTQAGYRGISFWMFRDQRIDDNWALIYAQKFALIHKCPLYVTFYLMSHYSVAGIREYDFMLKGLQQVEKQCQELGIQFHLEFGYAKDQIVEYCEKNQVDMVVTDFMPLRDPLNWAEEAGKQLKRKGIPLYQVDAHNIVPPWVATDIEARTASWLRPHIHRNLDEYLTEFPAIEKHPHQPEKKTEPADWDRAWKHINVDESVKPLTWCKPGTVEGYRMLFEFITHYVDRFVQERNIPTKHVLSNLSPWFHFGQVSVQRAILIVTQDSIRARAPESVDSYVEEAIIRRELSENFCFYQQNYDNINGAPEWARRSLTKHLKDKRERIYTLEEFQFGKTHDKIWNAAQLQMVREGKMHGYMRMYWAKKILEWTPNPEEALRIAIFLNDKYSMDGRDPQGYQGIMWSIVGAQDRAFDERPVVGVIRFMSYAGCVRKFDVDFYCRTYKN